MKKEKRVKANWFKYHFYNSLLKLFSIRNGQRIKKRLKIKGAAIVLSNHTTWFDFAYTMRMIKGRRIRFVAAEKMFAEPFLGHFLKISRAIPKKLYQADMRSMIEVLKDLKLGGIIGIFPEGQIATLGQSLEPGVAIAKLLKKCAVNIYTVKHLGASFANPAWSKKRFKGKWETESKLLMSADEVKQASELEIYQKVKAGLYYDPYQYNLNQKHRYKVKNIKGLENVVYLCPDCQELGLRPELKKLVCPHCQKEMIYDNYGYLDNHTLVAHYLRQKKSLQSSLLVNNDYCLKNEVVVKSYVSGKIDIIGEGTLSLSKAGYHFNGKLVGQDEQLQFEIKDVSSLPADLGRNIQIYNDKMFYQFEFNINYLPQQYVIFAEVLFEKYASSDKMHGTLVLMNQDGN
jgi:1-acyl-sn-glycerol-3-phosphate acyltransferase